MQLSLENFRYKELKKRLYFPALIPFALLLVYGLIVIWSASLSIPEASFPRQCLGIMIGLILGSFCWRYDYRGLANLSMALLVFSVVLMLLPHVPGLGVSAKGTDGWIQIPFVHLRFQPSELAKLVVIFAMAGFGVQYNGKITQLKDYLKLCFFLSIPFLLILSQPDLGTGLVILFTGACIIVASGAKRSWVLVTIAIIVCVAALAIWTSLTPGMFHVLKEYQLKRLIVFIDPSVDPAGNGYNVRQAEIAVGSGGLFGKGIGHATQAGNGFLPEAHTDFIFALLSEEFGFTGALILLLLYAALLFFTLTLALRTDSSFAKLVLVGIVAMWIFQIFENIGMCIRLMPITGIPLPFISFGSSSMIVQIMAVGVVQSIWRWRKKAA